MFIRETKKQRSKDSGVFYQYQLVQAERIDGKVRQRNILYLGSDPLLTDKDNRKTVVAILKSKIYGQPEMFPADGQSAVVKLALNYYEKYLIRYGIDKADTGGTAIGNNQESGMKQNGRKKLPIPPLPYKADYHQVDIKSMELAEVRSFGAEHLCLQVLDQLGLEDCLRDQGLNKERSNKALMAIAAKAIFSASEHKTSQILNMSSELAALSGLRTEQPIDHKELYRIADELYEHKNEIDRFIQQRTDDMFNLKDKLVIFDISNTYFEGAKRGGKLGQFGRSKEKRNDCKIVVFTAVINTAGFIRYSRIYEGNKADSKTLPDMLDDLQKHSDPEKEKQTVVIDAGIAIEENLQLITKKGYHYVCVSRKRLKDYPSFKDNELVYESTNRDKEEVKLSVFYPEGYNDCWMYVESEAKKRKEQSIDEKLNARYEQGLETIRNALTAKGGTKRIDKVWERIGRLKQKYGRPAGRYTIDVKETNGLVTQMTWKKKNSRIKVDKSEGIYFLRTSYRDPKEEDLWKIYNTIREVESTFRCLKTDLNIRPVYHQNDERVESHIYLTILAYQLVNTIRYQLKQSAIHYDWQNIKRIMNTQTIQTIILPTDKKLIHLRKPSKPIKEVEQIYQITNCKNTQKAVRKYVVYH